MMKNTGHLSTIDRLTCSGFNSVLPTSIMASSRTRSNLRTVPANMFRPPLPEQPVTFDQYDIQDDEDSITDTPTNLSASYQWSASTMTGSVTERSSYCSWTGVEGELDRLAGETVQRMFDAIDDALYKSKSTKLPEVDRECSEWAGNFVHFRVEGKHILDRGEDGVELLDPVYVDDGAVTPTNEEDPLLPVLHTSISDVSLDIEGSALPVMEGLTTVDVNDPYEQPGEYYEELIAADGEVEEYFAFDASGLDNKDCVHPKKATRLRHGHWLPPVTPSACVRDTAYSLVFDQVWSEVVTVLQPLLLKQKSLSNQRSPFAEGMPLAPPTTHVPIHEFFLPSDVGHQVPPTRGPLPHFTAQPLKQRLAAPGPLAPGVPTHSTDLPNLQKVITIRPVPLQQRVSSSALPAMVPSNSSFLVPQESQDNFMMYMYPDTSRMSRPSYTVLPSRTSEPKVISAKMGNKRNPLKPLEIPKSSLLHQATHGHGQQDDGIRDFSGLVGQRLVRHTQLPPLDTAHLERSPQLLRSSAKRQVTFSNRIVSAAPENGEIGSRSGRRQQSGNLSELRPSTTHTFRSDTPLARKGLLNAPSLGPTPIKVIGHAASLHHELVLWETQEEEDEEDIHQSEGGHLSSSLLLQSNPRSGHARGRMGRGHVR